MEIRGLSKAFGGVQALNRVSFGIHAGEVHALCGENGAGKSTLIKILAGIIRPDEGEVGFDGRPLAFGDVRRAEAAGVAVIHQESVAFAHLNAVDNLFVGRECCRFRGVLDRHAMARQAREILGRLGEDIDLNQPLEHLPLAQRQMVAIARALLARCRLLVMDEPTASLSAKESKVLFRQIETLRESGVGILYVSHRLQEIFQLADRVTVLRDGCWVSTDPCCDLDETTLIRRMVGREIAARSTASGKGPQEEGPRLTVRGLSRAPMFSDVSLDVYPGEIVGLGGLVGAGRSEVARCLFGLDDFDQGSIELNGIPHPGGSVAVSCASGMALVPEDRQHEGLIQTFSIGDNLTLPWLQRFTRRGVLRRSALKTLVTRAIKRLDVRLQSTSDPVSSLSGGNQQKVVLGKWLAGKPSMLILDEPTRGVDVGAKEEVYTLIRELAGEGVGILFISSDLPELIRLSHRILVMSEGKIRGELSGAAMGEEAVLRLALPVGNGQGVD